MTAEPFLLDAVDNPHPAMRRNALEYRARANIVEEHLTNPTANIDVLIAQIGVLIAWNAYLQAMCDATGCTAAELNAWLDREPVTPTVDVIGTL